ncbi:hypothetical protein DBR40_07530 [Pedobacter sp. KBW01]|nr:hypothetical protein DBR40_07530 [Pedobacter sp. KBW01]
MQNKKKSKTRSKSLNACCDTDHQQTSVIPAEMKKIFEKAPRNFSKNEQILLSLLVQIIVEITIREEL